jgi:hypothetical protein
MRREIYEILYLTSCNLLLDSSGVWSFPINSGIDDDCKSESLK